MKLDQYSQPIFQDEDIVALLYSGNVSALSKLTVDRSPDVANLIEYANLQIATAEGIAYNKTVLEQDTLNQSQWNIPELYRDFNIIDWCVSQCNTETGQIRVAEELVAYEQKGMIPLLRVLKYLVDTFRENNIVWGVGRGSSVSSYVLFVIGIHKIDSIKYNLDWHEFLR